MIKNSSPRKNARLKLIFVLSLFLGPLILSFIWYYGFDARFVPRSQSNYSVLLDPPVSLVITNDNNNGLSLSKLERKWTFLHLIDGVCDNDCQTMLYNTRQVRRAVGKDQNRIQRVIVYKDSMSVATLRQDHPEAIFVQSVTGDLVPQLKPIREKYGDSNEDVYIVDPLGNVIIHTSLDLEPRLLLKDVKKLLRISHIG